MSDSSRHFHGGELPRRPEVDLGERGHHLPPPARLQLSPQERATLSPDALALVSPLLTHDPSTWELAEVQAVTAALERANGNGEAAAVLSRLRGMGGGRLIRVHEDHYRPLVDEVRRINDEEVAARRRPVSDTYARYLARDRVDRWKREAGIAAAEAERERWVANPGSPQAQIAIQAVQARAEHDYEMRRPQLEADEKAKIEAKRVKRSNEKARQRASRKQALVKILKAAGVTVPSEPRELAL